MAKKGQKAKLSLNAVADRFGIDRRTATKLCRGLTTMKQAERAVADWQERKNGKANGNLDPSTGLSWFQAAQREDVLRARAEREREARLMGGELVPVSVMTEAGQIISGYFSRLVTEMTAAGADLNPNQRQALARFGSQFSDDFSAYIRQWVDRQLEILNKE